MSDPIDVNSSGDKHDEQQEPDELIFKNLDQFTAKNDSVTHKTTSTSTNPPSILDFCIVKPISKGAFGKVFLGYKNSKPSLLYAIKVMKKSEMINKNMVSQVITERNVLALSQSPFCVTLFYSLQSSSSIYLVMEYMVGGDLKSILAMYGFFDEATSRFYCAEILLALQYLHKHGIIHRDIKPDNMLVGADGHVKLTDFGLSKIDLHRDLEMSDLINCSPSLNTRTPGQLLSLTSHLSFGSNEKKTSRTETLASVKESEQSKIDSSMNDSKISGVSPFFSAEDINFSTSMTRKLMKIVESSGSSYTTADASTASSNIYMTSSANDIQINIECDSTSDSDKENSAKNFSFSMVPVKSVAFKFHEDSGISSRKSDTSTNNQYENSAANYSNANTTSSDLSRSNISDKSKHELHSPIRPTGRGFKRPDFHRSMSRKRTLTNHAEFSIEGDGCQHTGLTQEIEINLDIGSSTPKKHKSQSHASPGNLFKIKSSPDDSIRLSAINPSLIVSTPVSTQKITRGKKKNNMLRFAIPHSSVERQRLLQYSKLTDDPAVSPIQNAVRSIDEITPKMAKTPFRTPKSVRRGVMGSDAERILGTPDYLAPELLMMKGHGMAVDWWALGVCLYEFMTGIPPFNDETPQKVFENILNRNIEWPVDDEALSEESMEMVESMLTMSPSARPSAEECKAMKFFASVDFDNILNANPPFVPSLDDPLDTGYFQARNEMQHLELSNFEMS